MIKMSFNKTMMMMAKEREIETSKTKSKAIIISPYDY